jgi:pimeloyl-ACP methyl ester carboxylesterase
MLGVDVLLSIADQQPNMTKYAVQLASTERWKVYHGSVALKAVVVILCGLVGLLWTWRPPLLDIDIDKASKGTSEASTPHTSDFSWLTAPTYKYLKYAPCYPSWGEFQCARLELPLDYWNGTTNATLSLAVIRKPAIVPLTDPRYAGPLIVNPGGPGGSGIEYVVGAGDRIRHSVDSLSVDDPNGKFFDIISFDPRGVGFTTPNANCFADSRLGKGWALRVMEEGVLGASDATFGRLWSMAIARAGSCSLPLDDGKDIKPYVTTAHTSRDMLELVEHHGRWREAEARRLVSSGTVGCHESVTQPARLAVDTRALEALKYKPGQEKMYYSGGSYGTYLGLTFAAMFPDRIHRMRVDGVVDAYDYRKVLWTDNLRDTENEVQQFYYHCARAGYPACALANTVGETTVAAVEARVQNITNSLIHNPLPVIGPNPEVITYSDAKHLIFAGMYSPIRSFPQIAYLLAGVEQGNGTLFADLLRPYHKLTCPSDDDTGFSIVGILAPDATMAIACADGDDQSSMTKSQYSDYWHDLAKLSPSIGPMWAMFRMYCIHYNTRPAHRFTAPFEANTSHPILMIGNTYDPVTPLKNAFTMSKGYPGSVVLTQNSTGHTSGSVYSSCTIDHIRKYFQTGVLPEKGTVCEPDELPFGNAIKSGSDGEVSDDIKNMYAEGHAAMLRSIRGSPGMDLAGRFAF